MKNNNFFKKNKIYLTIGILFIIWVCFIIFAIIPSFKSLKNNFDSVQMKMIEAQNNSDKLSKLDGLRSSFERTNSEKDNLEVIFSKNNIVDLVKELEAIAQNTQNNIVISVDEQNKKITEVNKSKTNSKESEFLKSLPVDTFFTIKIKLTGNYNGLIKFMDKLNNIKYYNSVISFDVKSEEIVVEKKSNNEEMNSNGGINVLNSGDISNDSINAEEKKMVLNSDLEVIFYSLEKNDEKK